MESISIDVTAAKLAECEQALRVRVKRLIEDISYTSYEPGSLSGALADLSAIARIKPALGGPKAAEKRTAPTEQEARTSQKAAERRHNRAEERRASQGGE